MHGRWCKQLSAFSNIKEKVPSWKKTCDDIILHLFCFLPAEEEFGETDNLAGTTPTPEADSFLLNGPESHRKNSKSKGLTLCCGDYYQQYGAGGGGNGKFCNVFD